MLPEIVHRTLILGDFHYGENYTRSGAEVLRDSGYGHSVRFLREFAASCDEFVLNLETPLVSPSVHSSPYAEAKRYVHWGDPKKVPAALKELGVTAVGLANNHTVDFGQQGLISTFDTLDANGIEYFGAGRSLGEAIEPLRIALPERVGGGEVAFHASFEFNANYDRKFRAYAGPEHAGCAPLSGSVSPAPVSTSNRRGSTLRVAFPHWGSNYRWRSNTQRRLARDLLDDEFDVIIGHGSHSLQEVFRLKRRWIVYSLGNGNFLSAGRFADYSEKFGVLPLGFWGVLEVVYSPSRNDRFGRLKLYPVSVDNLETNYQPAPVDERTFERAVAVLESRARSGWQFRNEALSLGSDSLGFHLLLELGRWPLGGLPGRLPPVGSAR